jgi:hypothetical protein
MCVIPSDLEDLREKPGTSRLAHRQGDLLAVGILLSNLADFAGHKIGGQRLT